MDTLGREGGYVRDPADPGGETKFGISKRAYPDLNIKLLTADDAIAIYCRDYWQKPGISRIQDHDLARKTFDLGVNTGSKRAIRMLQRAINIVCDKDVKPARRAVWRQKVARLMGGGVLAVDGILGPVTAQVVNACPYPGALLAALKGEAYLHYRDLNPLYIPGWLERLES